MFDILSCKLYANSVHVVPVQMPRYAAAGIGLHFLPVFLFLGVMHKWARFV